MSLFDAWKDEYDVESIDKDCLVLRGGGDFYDYGGEPDDETYARAREIAAGCGMDILHARGEWWGWSEYTPDPGSVSIFHWEKL